jgi:hypoxanthine phosphoribosyltransferase
MEDVSMLNPETSPMYKDLESLLFSRAQIEARVRELGAALTRDYAGREPVCICILKGATMFFSDLIRAVDLPLRLDFMSISSYGAATKTSGVVRILKDLDKDIVGRDVIIIEDIIDSGLTLSYLVKNLKARGARSLAVCVLLDKYARREVDLVPDYIGFRIEDRFVVGYGLDYAEKYRNLPDIGVLRPDVYSA